MASVNDSIELPLRRLENTEATLTVTVVRTREWKIRVWLATWLIWLGYRVLGCDAKTTVEEAE